ncbi:MAG: hypothetical protein AAGA56_22290 [Myxococcota bacterium]
MSRPRPSSAPWGLLLLLLGMGCHLIAGTDDFRDEDDDGPSGDDPTVTSASCNSDPVCASCLLNTATLGGTADCCTAVLACAESDVCLEEIACLEEFDDIEGCLSDPLSIDIAGCAIDCEVACDDGS